MVRHTGQIRRNWWGEGATTRVHQTPPERCQSVFFVGGNLSRVWENLENQPDVDISARNRLQEAPKSVQNQRKTPIQVATTNPRQTGSTGLQSGCFVAGSVRQGRENLGNRSTVGFSARKPSQSAPKSVQKQRKTPGQAATTSPRPAGPAGRQSGWFVAGSGWRDRENPGSGTNTGFAARPEVKHQAAAASTGRGGGVTGRQEGGEDPACNSASGTVLW